ncbi:hypothetical protein [Limosilactobacillus antri]|uniref:hypothetical protein n=1 Tax=Limosilactobacillus antri TaxID=227943 RepID=UPI001F570A72|nr:hypothetical protein [Limosilactobacillus antri]
MKKIGLLVAVLAFMGGLFIDGNQVSASSTTIASMNPKQVAATVLVAGAQKNKSWKGFVDGYQDQGMKLSVLVDEDSPILQKNYLQPGTGTEYRFQLDNADQWEVNDYTISADGKYVYCYQQQFHNSAERHVSPFLVLSASKIAALQHSSSASQINQIANAIKIKVDN